MSSLTTMVTTDPSDREDDAAQELRVTFYPELFLQRRMWILNILRQENITRVLDVGCGEGQLLTVLCQPAPWLTPPPSSVLPTVELSPDELVPPTPTYNDEIPNLHTTFVAGLDISPQDLAFAVLGSAPPEETPDDKRSYYNISPRWEDLEAKILKGGLEVINEEFVDIECIVSTEVIEHLPEPIFSAFAPVLLGVYHPRFFLVTTPSYTYNARFTAPNAPPSARNGFPDPTKRTNRIFRHDDHQFEWTTEEFQSWCHSTAEEWGYTVQMSAVGRALEVDPWGRDEELGGASSAALFIRLENYDSVERERRGRETLKKLPLGTKAHELLAVHKHVAHSSARQPRPLSEIAAAVKAKMEEYREAFMRVEEIWFEREIAILCGGWIEVLVRAVEESEDLHLKREGDEIKNRRTMWVVELVGGVANPQPLWPAGGDTSLDYIPPDWTPGEGPYDSSEDGESTGAEGDVSWNNSEEEEDEETDRPHEEWSSRSWGETQLEGQDAGAGGWDRPGAAKWGKARNSSSSSTAGWDGDESDDSTE